MLHVDADTLLVHPACAGLGVVLQSNDVSYLQELDMRVNAHRQVEPVFLARLRQLELSVVCPELVPASICVSL